MKYRKLTNGDYSFGGNIANFVTDEEAVAQAIKTKILLFYGEWWEDVTIGIPMFQSILGQANREGASLALRTLVEKRLMEVPEVQNLQDVKLSYDERTVTLSVSVLLTSGETIEVEVLS